VTDQVGNDSIQMPATKLARSRSSLECWSIPQANISDSKKFDRAFVEFYYWMFVIKLNNAAVLCNVDVHPHGILSTGCLRMLRENPPGQDFQPEVFGLHSWGDIVAAIDVTRKGYFTRTDLAEFWARFGVHGAYMKNRKGASIKTLAELTSEFINSMLVVSEEALLRDPNNTSRTCTLNSGYVDTMDLKLKEDDKAYLYAQGRKETLAWVKKRASNLC